jgi:aquaporin Z
LRRDFTWRRVPCYWLTQIVGATVAALLLRSTLGTVGHLGRSETTLSASHTITLEAVLSAFLVLVILNTASRHSLIGTDAALAVGATIGLCGLFAATLSGASMNSARSLGPAIVDGHLGIVWLYVVGPALGALVAVVLSFALHPHRDSEDAQLARRVGRRARLPGGSRRSKWLTSCSSSTASPTTKTHSRGLDNPFRPRTKRTRRDRCQLSRFRSFE